MAAPSITVCPKCGFPFTPREDHDSGHIAHSAQHLGHLGGLGTLTSIVFGMSAGLAHSAHKKCPTCGEGFFIGARPCEIGAFRVAPSSSERRIVVGASMVVRGAKDHQLGVIVRFFFSDGTPLVDRNNRCRDSGGQVALIETRPIASYYQTFILSDLVMADDELHLALGQNYPLSAMLTAYVVEGENWVEVAQTAMAAFRWHVPLPGTT